MTRSQLSSDDEKLIQELDDLGYPARTNRDPLAAIK